MSESDPSSIFSQKNSRLPEDTVFFSIYPDSSLSNQNSQTTLLPSLHLQILQYLSQYTTNYIWQHEPFTLSPCPPSNPIPHLHGKLKYGDNLEDEWFIVFLLFQTSQKFPNLSIQTWDTDGEFLLIESAFHLPKWINPETTKNRIFIRNNNLHIIPKDQFPSNPTLENSLSYLIHHENNTIAPESVQLSIKNRIKEYPKRAIENMHKVRVRVPVLIAQILKHEPCLISLAVEGFYDRDIDSMKYASKMERFLPKNKSFGDEMVEVSVVMSRAMYAQLMQQTFQAPKCYPMPARSESVYTSAELGMKIACGFEMMYQVKKKEGVEGKGSTWEVYKESLEKNGYFEGLINGSKEYKRLMENAESYFKKSSLHSRESEIMSAPVNRIDEIIANCPISLDEFKNQEIPPSDDDSWLYNGEDELNAALFERQQEMELYDMKNKKNNNKEDVDVGPSSSSNLNDYDLGDIAKSMQEFVKKMSSFEGAEVPNDRNSEDVDLDVERFMKEIESVMNPSNANDDEELDSDMDLDDDDEDIEDDDEIKDEQNAFMRSYSDALSQELKSTTLDKSFVRANEPELNKEEGTSNGNEEDVDDEEFTPIDVDVNLVKNFLGSFSSQEGLPGPASNLLGLMGLQLPQDHKDK